MVRGADDLQGVLRSAFAAGRAAHPSIALAPEPFVEHLLALATTLDGGAGGMREAAEQYAADLFLAIACDRDCPGAWSRWTELFAAPLRAYARRRGAAAADAEEVVASLPGDLLQPPSDGRFATRMGAYRGAGPLLAWLGRIVDHRLADQARARRSAGSHAADRDPAAACGPPDSVIYTETGQRVARAFEGALRGLSPREFGLLVLRYRDDLPQTEIAEREGVSPARINFLFKRIVTRVRAHVLMEIPDETSAHWLGRDGLATVLKDVIARILGKDR